MKCLKNYVRITKDEYDKKDNTELEAYQKFGSPEEVAEMLKITEQSLKRNVVLKRIINAVKDILRS